MNIYKLLRKEKKLTQKELADLFYLDQTTVSKWELGKALPDLATLTKLADFYDVSVDYLLGRQENKTEQKKPIAERQASDLADNFIKEFGEYFSEQNFIKLAKLYKVMSAEQALIAIGWIAGMLEQSGVKVKNIL